MPCGGEGKGAGVGMKLAGAHFSRTLREVGHPATSIHRQVGGERIGHTIARVGSGDDHRGG